MSNLTVLYLGPPSGTSLHRAEALRRLGCEVLILDPRSTLPASKVVDTWIWQTGGLFLESMVKNHLLSKIPSKTFDLVHIDCGSLVSRELVRELKRRANRVVNYNNDDPFGQRDARKWRQYLEAVPEYDLTVVLRACNVEEAQEAGAADVMHLTMSADEVAHSPRQISASEAEAFASDVLFIGTWMPERGPFLASLLNLQVPLSLYGNRWSKAREWPQLRAHWKGKALSKPDDYAKAVQCAKVCLGLLSRGNRDQSTQRSFEIPLLGGVLCAERTPEHLALYRENEEAVFWSTPEECADKCSRLLADDEWRLSIARKGRERCLTNGSTNEVVFRKILERVFPKKAAAAAQSGSATISSDCPTGALSKD